jgi:hypothetical protein
MMLFGMGMTLTKEEDKQLQGIVHPCYAALGLANDYFSFDREYKEMRESEEQSMTNAIWLFMRWHNVDIATAKAMVRQATNKYEKQFLEFVDDFRRTHAPLSEKLETYLRGLAYQISGNVVWSLNCPRYHPKHRYSPNAGVEDARTAEALAQADDPALVELAWSMSADRSHQDEWKSEPRKSSMDSVASIADTLSSSVENGESSVTSRSTSPDQDPSLGYTHPKTVRLDPLVCI